MALDKNDIELLRQMMTDVSREVCGKLVKESETRMMTYMESHIEKKIDLLADGMQGLSERMDRLEARVDEMNETVLANTMYIIKDASAKRKAQ